MKKISISTSQRNELIDITHDVQDALEIDDGVITVYCPHTTAGITINEGADPDVRADIIRRLNELSPVNPDYKHSEGNSDAHIKSSLIGNSVQVVVEKSRLQFGTWQAIFFCEFDGPRKREVWIK